MKRTCRLILACASLFVAVPVLQSTGNNNTIILSGIPGPYAFHRFCRLGSEWWSVGGDGSIHAHSWHCAVEEQRPTETALNAVCFLESGSGWIAGESGVIMHTTDWGNHWILQKSGVTGDLNSVACTDDLHCWISGNKGTVLVTEDGGLNWSCVRLGVMADLQAVYFLDNVVGWAVGRDGIVAKSTDGGHSWSIHYLRKELFPGIPSEGPTHWSAVRFSSSTHGWLAGPRWVASTEDGATWKCKHIDCFDGIGVVSQDGQIVWAVDDGACNNYWSRDGGRTWAKCQRP